MNGSVYSGWGNLTTKYKTVVLLEKYTAWVEIASGACEKVASNFGQGVGFRRGLRFHPPLKTGWSRLSRNVAEKVTKIKIQISKY